MFEDIWRTEVFVFLSHRLHQTRDIHHLSLCMWKFYVVVLLLTKVGQLKIYRSASFVIIGRDKLLYRGVIEMLLQCRLQIHFLVSSFTCSTAVLIRIAYFFYMERIMSCIHKRILHRLLSALHIQSVITHWSTLSRCKVSVCWAFSSSIRGTLHEVECTKCDVFIGEATHGRPSRTCWPQEGREEDRSWPAMYERGSIQEEEETNRSRQFWVCVDRRYAFDLKNNYSP